jgi:hypothetical protein
MTGPWAGAPPGKRTGPGQGPGSDAHPPGGSSLPTIAEPADQKTVRGGRVVRSTLRRTDAGGCQDCGQAWTGPLAFLWATEHTLQTQHITIAGRIVAYRYQPAGGAP